ALSFSPLLLSSLSRLLSAGEDQLARDLARDALRLVVLLLPLAGMIAGAAPEIVGLIFGPDYLPAAPLLTLLIFSGLFFVILSVSTAVLTAKGRLWWIFALTGPLPVLAVVGHLVLIPRLGALGAALVTTLC